MFTTITEAVKWIESVKRFGDKLDLSRMELACKKLGNPERKLPVIHVAGTNGKGSTVAFLKSILLQSGYNVGTYTSPYIVRFNERINYNNQDISDEDLLKYINKVNSLYNEVLAEYNQVITFFELVTLISFMYFSDLPVDYVIYEVGLGGTLDATNVVLPKVTAITSISYDHMGVLGDTLESIAMNKLGIVKAHAPLITTVNNQDLYPLFEQKTIAKNVPLIWINEDSISNISYAKYMTFEYNGTAYTSRLLGYHQAMNASLAIEIINYLIDNDNLEISNDDIEYGITNAFWPGRLERYHNVLFDGAHNIGGVLALKDAINDIYKDQKIIVLYTVMHDKEYFDMIKEIETFADEIYFTEFDYPRCEKARNLYDVSSHPRKHMNSDAYETYELLQEKYQDAIIVITGSLYFVSYMRKYIVK